MRARALSVGSVVSLIVIMTTPVRTQALEVFGPAIVTAYRSSIQPDGSEVVGVTISSLAGLSGCAAQSWWGHSLTIRSTSPNFKTLLSAVIVAFLSGRPVTGVVYDGCAGINGNYQVMELQLQN